MTNFFPEPIFCWLYLLLLGSLLIVASYIDFRTLTIPKWLSLSVLGGGVVMNLIRGAWLGETGNSAWVLSGDGILLGGIDGLLFAVVGFLAGFGLFFLLWIGGICGGGDVKLFAALGTWTGLSLLLWVLAVTAVLLAIFVFGQVFWLVMTGQGSKLKPNRKQIRNPQLAGKGLRAKRRALGFSLPLAIACLLVLPWAFRYELRLATHPTPVPGEKTAAGVLWNK